MQINISNLSEGEYSYDFSEDAGTFGFDANFTGPVAAHVTLGKSLNQIIATIHASIKGVFVCDRCAREYESAVETTFHSVYTWDDDQEEGEDDDYHVLAPDQNIIDIAPGVKEYLLLAIPLKQLCGRKDCSIPQHQIKEEKGIDPRWEKLRQLKR